MRTRKNPIPPEYQRPRPLIVGGFADDDVYIQEQDPLPRSRDEWDRNCDGDVYESLDLRHIDFSNASLVGTKFINCDLRGCSFYYTDLTNTEFIRCDLRGARLIGIKSSFINFEKSDVRDFMCFYDFREPSVPDFSTFNWNQANLEGAWFTNLDFVKYVYDLHEGKIEAPNIYIQGLPRVYRGQDIRGLDLRNSRFLRNANLASAFFSNTKLQGADLRGADIRGYHHLTKEALRGAIYNDETRGLTDDLKSIMIYEP